MQIDIKIRPHSRLKEFFHKTHDRLEDILFSIIEKIPDRFIPHCVMVWLERYMNKRLAELKHQTVKQAWTKMYLEEAIQQQRTNKAPSEDD